MQLMMSKEVGETWQQVARAVTGFPCPYFPTNACWLEFNKQLPHASNLEKCWDAAGQTQNQLRCSFLLPAFCTHINGYSTCLKKLNNNKQKGTGRHLVSHAVHKPEGQYESTEEHTCSREKVWKVHGKIFWKLHCKCRCFHILW